MHRSNEPRKKVCVIWKEVNEKLKRIYHMPQKNYFQSLSELIRQLKQQIPYDGFDRHALTMGVAVSGHEYGWEI